MTITTLDLYERMLYLRCAEEALAREYKKQEMKTPTHFGVGQEAIAVGVCAALTDADVVYSHHRCHNHYLAKGGDLISLAAELYGREAGCSRGRGGSVHLTAPSVGFIASSAILGQSIPVAVGSALAFKMDNSQRVAVSFFGDAACEEGVFYESLNFAAIHKLPVLFVCENNLYSTESPLSKRMAGTLMDRTRSFGIEYEPVDGNNVTDVHDAAKWWVEQLRNGHGPGFLECSTYRHLEHVGPNLDHEVGRTYRTKDEWDKWAARDPLCVGDGAFGQTDLVAARERVRSQVDADIAVAYRMKPAQDLMANA